MMYCSNCDIYFEDDEYCPNCGRSMKCPECGSPIDEYAETCGNCGAVFASEDGNYFDNPYDIRD